MAVVKMPTSINSKKLPRDRYSCVKGDEYHLDGGLKFIYSGCGYGYTSSQFIKKLERGEQNTMWTIEKLKKRFSMSDQQIYRRLNAAQRQLDQHINRGEKNAIALTEGGFLILENVIELEKQGKTLANAVQEVQKSIFGHEPPAPSFEITQNGVDMHLRNSKKLYETHSQSLTEEVGYLKGKLDGKNERLEELKEEIARLRQENDDLKRSVALVEYKVNERHSWWPWK